MDNQRLLLSLAALMMACTPLAGADVPDPDGVCDGAEPANVDCEVIAGPASLTVKSVLSVGIGFCQTETTDIPLQCEGNAGDITGAGAATFGDPTWVGDRSIHINVVHDQSTCTAATSPPCGFTADICNDRDQDSTCTNIGDNDDELFDTAASEGVLGECKDQEKDCDDPNEAGWVGCMNDSIFSDWDDEQIIVFIGAEAGPAVDLGTLPTIDPNDLPGTAQSIAAFVLGTTVDVQAAVVVGTFTVWMEDLGATTCPDEPTPDAEPLACEADWTAGAMDGSADNPFNGASCATSGSCSSDYLGNGYDPGSAPPGQDVVTVTCTAFEACEPMDVETMANLLLGNESVQTEIYCDDVLIASSYDNRTDGNPVLDWGTKTDGTYRCVFTFVITSAPYHAEGACRDKPAPPSPPPTAHVTIHHFPDGHSLAGNHALQAADGGWGCVGGNGANLVVGTWIAIGNTSPASVTCTPPTGGNNVCQSVDAVGYHGPTSIDITVKSDCPGGANPFFAQKTFSTGANIAGADRQTGSTALPSWTCSVTWTGSFGPNDDWWTGCDVNKA